MKYKFGMKFSNIFPADWTKEPPKKLNVWRGDSITFGWEYPKYGDIDGFTIAKLTNGYSNTYVSREAAYTAVSHKDYVFPRGEAGMEIQNVSESDGGHYEITIYYDSGLQLVGVTHISVIEREGQYIY